MKRILLYVLMALTVLASCGQEEPELQLGVSEIDNPRQDKTVARFGETVTVTFMADAAWEAELVLSEGECWAEIAQTLGQDAAGKGTVRIRFKKNETDAERSAELFVSVAGGASELIASFTQAAGDATSAMSSYLNEYMHKVLAEDYLWADAYNELEVDMSVTYDKFLYTNLTKLGDTNIEDGGYYRDYSSSAGERYIYSRISEVASTKAGELASVYGLGIGPLFASLLEEGTSYIGLTVGYVYPGSPAESAGLRRGDTIYEVGNTRITKTNYQSYMNELLFKFCINSRILTCVAYRNPYPFFRNNSSSCVCHTPFIQTGPIPIKFRRRTKYGILNSIGKCLTGSSCETGPAIIPVFPFRLNISVVHIPFHPLRINLF